MPGRRRVRDLLVGCMVAAVTLGASGAVARNFGLGTGYTDPARAPLFSLVRARLLHEGYSPAKLQHDYRDLCANQDWSRVCKRFPETLDCDGDASSGECDFVFERPASEVPAHGRYLLVSTVVTHRSRVVDHQQPADSEDLDKIEARTDLQRKGCGPRQLLKIRVCDLAWPPSSNKLAAGARPLHLPRWWHDPEHGPSYSVVRASLISEGYRPAKLQHDDRDLCTEDFWSHVCKTKSETVDCQSNDRYGYCDFAYEMPTAVWAVHGPYLLVEAALTEDKKTVVVFRHVAGTDDLHKIWARKNLRQRGCQEDRLLLTRVCDPSWSPHATKPKAASLPDLPPLPPSLH